MKRALVLVLIILVLFGLFACKKSEPQPPADVFYSVQFTTTLLPYTATAPETQSVKAGECAAAPTFAVTPTAGYALIWTTDPAARSPYDFTAAVNGDLLLYAVETPRTYRVTYLTDRGTVPASNTTTFTKDTATFALKDVVLDYDLDFGYTFRYWSYFDDPDSVVTEIEQGTEGDVILRAHIETVRYDVYYKEAGDEFEGEKYYYYGDTMSLGTPLREGYTFLGWTIYMDSAHTPVTALTPDFVKAHKEALFHGNGSGIGLLANWEESE